MLIIDLDKGFKIVLHYSPVGSLELDLDSSRLRHLINGV